MNKKTIAGLIGSALLLVGTQAQAEITWTFDSNPNSGFTTVNSTTVAQTSGGVTATVQGWSNTNNGTPDPLTGPTNASRGTNDLATSGSYLLETAYLTVYDGGIGVRNRDASSSSSFGDLSETGNTEHSMDNNQRYDSVLFSFNNAIDLNSVTIGWKGADSDISLLAYTGTGSCVGNASCTSNLSGKKYTDLINFGWTFIGHYTNLANNVAKAVNAGNVASSYWLIGALNPLVGATNITKGDDYVKLLALAGDKYTPPCTPGTPGCGGGGTSVPEPGTLLLMGAGLFGLSRFNARRPLRFAA